VKRRKRPSQLIFLRLLHYPKRNELWFLQIVFFAPYKVILNNRGLIKVVWVRSWLLLLLLVIKSVVLSIRWLHLKLLIWDHASLEVVGANCISIGMLLLILTAHVNNRSSAFLCASSMKHLILHLFCLLILLSIYSRCFLHHLELFLVLFVLHDF